MNEAELQKKLASFYHDLNILRAREVKYSGNAPLGLLNQIKDYETAISLVEARLDGKISAEALEEGLQPLILEFRSAVSIDRRLVKIGALTMPTALLAALLLVVVGVLGFLGYTFIGPRAMPLGNFNIAVAEFGQLDDQGHVSRSEDGRNLSLWLFGKLQSRLKEFPLGETTIWHDSLNLFQKRAKIGLIEGKTPLERRDAAKVLAEQIGAKMVIYGNLAVNQDPVDFEPEFYIASLRNEADEIVGSQQLGNPIAVRLPIDLRDAATDAFFEGQLGSRVDALAYFTRGLALDLSGNYQDALNVFTEAEETLTGWRREGQGKEIIYYFIGREALFVGREQPEILVEAEAAFQEALAINPDYTRAYIGLGGVYFQRGQDLIIAAGQSEPPAPAVLEYLDQAIEAYQLAMNQPSDIPEAQVEIKSRLALGTAYSLKGQAHLRLGQPEQAEALYGLAITQLGQVIDRLDSNQHRIRAQGYLALGAAYQGQAHLRVSQADMVGGKALFEEARQAYEQCSQEAEAEFYDTFLQEIKTNFCDRYRDDVEAEIGKL